MQDKDHMLHWTDKLALRDIKTEKNADRIPPELIKNSPWEK